LLFEMAEHPGSGEARIRVVITCQDDCLRAFDIAVELYKAPSRSFDLLCIEIFEAGLELLTKEGLVALFTNPLAVELRAVELVLISEEAPDGRTGGIIAITSD
jgi:hypothetical protein